MLAGISVDYVVRLEQGRGPHPSAQVLGSLARALRMDVDGRDELFRLAGIEPPSAGTIAMHVRPSVLRLVDRFADLPVLVMSAKGDILAWNAMASALMGDWSAVRPERRNIHLIRFDPRPEDLLRSQIGMTTEEQDATSAHAVAALRSVAARYPADAGLTSLIAHLRRVNGDFARLWESTSAGAWRSLTKTVEHPTLGTLVLDCDTFHVPDTDQSLIVYSAEPGSYAAEALALLRVVGTQEFVDQAR